MTVASTECDHIGDPHDHGLHNLQTPSTACYAPKTDRQKLAALATMRAKLRHPSTDRPPPGLIG